MDEDKRSLSINIGVFVTSTVGTGYLIFYMLTSEALLKATNVFPWVRLAYYSPYSNFERFTLALLALIFIAMLVSGIILLNRFVKNSLLLYALIGIAGLVGAVSSLTVILSGEMIVHAYSVSPFERAAFTIPYSVSELITVFLFIVSGFAFLVSILKLVTGLVKNKTAIRALTLFAGIIGTLSGVIALASRSKAESPSPFMGAIVIFILLVSIILLVFGMFSFILKEETRRKIWSDKASYILLIHAFVATAIFNYWPFYGIILPFKDFDIQLGIWGSPWGKDGDLFYYFKQIFLDPDSTRAIRNTLIISVNKMIILTVVIIAMALLLNEIRIKWVKRPVQTIIYLPHFFSWVVMATVVIGMFSSSTGVFTLLFRDFFGLEINVLTNPNAFRPMLYITDIWKGAGFGTIIYLAAIAGVNPELYESATMDGANRFKMVWFITLPSIKSTIWLLFLLDVSGILNAGFDQVYNLLTPSTRAVGEIIDTFVFDKAFDGSAQFSYAQAVGISKQIIGVAMLLIMNWVATLTGEESII